MKRSLRNLLPMGESNKLRIDINAVEYNPEDGMFTISYKLSDPKMVGSVMAGSLDKAFAALSKVMDNQIASYVEEKQAKAEELRLQAEELERQAQAAHVADLVS